MADKINIKKSAYVSIERGNKKSKINTLQDIAKVFGCIYDGDFKFIEDEK